MSEFSELVKRFDKIRSYVRDFYVYGFKTREDYQNGSGRTYDNERRRIESWFGPYIHSGYQKDHKKAVAITIDSSRIGVNPLFAAWKSKSFTSNDIMLHFFLMDLFSNGTGRTADQCTDEIATSFGVLFDTQTVRKKLAEYETAGLIRSEREGRRLLYKKVETPLENSLTKEPAFWDLVSFYQGAAPFGFIGSTILDNRAKENRTFRFKHDFLVHTLEDEVLFHLLAAIKRHMAVRLEYKNAKNGRIRNMEGTPLKILCSTQTGRRYVCLYHGKTKRLSNCRLDGIRQVDFLREDPDYDLHQSDLKKNRELCWGVSFGETRGLETLTMTIALDEEREAHIVNRLEREGRGGTVTREAAGLYRYERTCFDCNEILPWVKTFTGRIVSLSCSNPMITKKFYHDMERMAKLYGEVPSNEV